MKPAVGGIPARAKTKIVMHRATRGILFPRPLKLSRWSGISNLSVFAELTIQTTAPAAIKAPPFIKAWARV
jgi:hypothetical protein